MEGAGILPGASGGHRGLWTGMYAARRSSAYRIDVRLAIHHLARHPAHSLRQAGGRAAQDEYSADSQRGTQARRGWAVSAESARTADTGPLGAFHGHRSQGDRLIPGLAVLLSRR